MPCGEGVLGLLVVDGELDEAVQVGQAGVAAAAAPSLQQLALGIKADHAPRSVCIGSRGNCRSRIGRHWSSDLDVSKDLAGIAVAVEQGMKWPVRGHGQGVHPTVPARSVSPSGRTDRDGRHRRGGNAHRVQRWVCGRVGWMTFSQPPLAVCRCKPTQYIVQRHAAPQSAASGASFAWDTVAALSGWGKPKRKPLTEDQCGKGETLTTHVTSCYAGLTLHCVGMCRSWVGYAAAHGTQ